MPWPSPLPPLKLAGYSVRRSARTDVPAIVALLLEDPVSAARETSPQRQDLSPYYAAFDAVDADQGQLLAVVDEDSSRAAPIQPFGANATSQTTCTNEAGRVVGTAQLSLIPGLTRGGALRLQVEGVHVAADLQGKGVGTALFDWIDEVGRASGAKLAQLTTDKRRADAHKFYTRLGWVASHDGMKKVL